MQISTRRGRPPGSRKYHLDEVIRRAVHLTVHRHRQPLLAEWLAAQDERGLATSLVDLIERALSGGTVGLVSGREGAMPQVFEVDMSGLMEWD